MIRCFLVLAVAGGSLLVVDIGVGCWAAAEVSGPHDGGRVLHRLVSSAAVVVVLGTHATVIAYFLATCHRVEAAARAEATATVDRLPDWYLAQSRRNARRPLPCIVGGATAITIAAGLGVAAESPGAAWSAWHLGAATLAVAFNLGSFAVEYAAMVGQARLLGDLEDHARRPGGGRLGPAAAGEGRSAVAGS